MTKCNLHGEAYTLSGCSMVPLCVAPNDVTGYEVTETSLYRDSFDVKVQCALGRKPWFFSLVDHLTGAKRREWMGLGEWDDYY